MSELAFHELRVTEVASLTNDSVAITLDVPSELAETFTYLPGQHVTLRRVIDGEDVRRSYSICAAAATTSSLVLLMVTINGGRTAQRPYRSEDGTDR